MTPDASFDILVAGEINPDLILTGDVNPEFGQVEKLVASYTLAIGSSSAIFACGGIKIIYDLLLFRAFSAVKPPEENSVA